MRLTAWRKERRCSDCRKPIKPLPFKESSFRTTNIFAFLVARITSLQRSHVPYPSFSNLLLRLEAHSSIFPKSSSSSFSHEILNAQCVSPESRLAGSLGVIPQLSTHHCLARDILEARVRAIVPSLAKRELLYIPNLTAYSFHLCILFVFRENATHQTHVFNGRSSVVSLLQILFTSESREYYLLEPLRWEPFRF